MRMLWNMEKSEMVKRNVLFQEEDRDTYAGAMLGMTKDTGRRLTRA